MQYQEGQYVVAGACNACGVCRRACPVGAIRSGSPFSIDQEACIRCGECKDACPQRAIRRIGDDD